MSRTSAANAAFPFHRATPPDPTRPRVPPAAVVAASFVCGAVPFSQIAARCVRGVDLRTVGNGTVSGTALHRVAGFGPLAMAGVFEVAKGAVGPALAGAERPELAALAGASAVVGHNWSPFLRLAGGRGLSPSIGALLARAPAGAAVLLGGMAAGRAVRETASGTLVADLLLVPLTARVHGRGGRMLAMAVLVPMIAKRLVGNVRPPRGRVASTLVSRLLFDRDRSDS
jgi:glycerol-3-phosphate acyltransferase PlsY